MLLQMKKCSGGLRDEGVIQLSKLSANDSGDILTGHEDKGEDQWTEKRRDSG